MSQNSQNLQNYSCGNKQRLATACRCLPRLKSGIKIIDMIDVEALKAYAYDTIGAIHEVTQAASVRMRRKAGRLAAFLVQIKVVL